MSETANRELAEQFNALARAVRARLREIPTKPTESGSNKELLMMHAFFDNMEQALRARRGLDSGDEQAMTDADFEAEVKRNLLCASCTEFELEHNRGTEGE